jgi:glycerol-3-phosphate dehydrogenase
MAEEHFDVLIVGGGINGAVAAACLSARGAKVALVDGGDFASGTSQQSSNLAWGGVKYLESYEFGLVHKLCRSRNLLLRSYPSTVREIRFFVAHERGFRHPVWFLYFGVLFYWLIGACFTRAPRWLSKRAIEAEEPVIDTERVDGGFEYSDAYLHDNDARFVWSFIDRAISAGAAVANYVRLECASRDDSGWVARCSVMSPPRALLPNEATTGSQGAHREPITLTIRARVLINACGPYADALTTQLQLKTSHKHVFSKGIHLLVARISKSNRVLTFFADDGRLFFVIPMGPRTCIGTTDTREDAPTETVTDADRTFVLENINKRLRLANPLTTADIIAERCGVRPLVVPAGGGTSKETEWSQLSRKHVIEVDRQRALLTIFGGKLTDCINVGEEAAAYVANLGVALSAPDAPWFGEGTRSARALFLIRARKIDLDAYTAAESSEPLSERLWRRYGVRASRLVDAIEADPREAEVLIHGAEYIRAELKFAAKYEMIVTLEDFLRRRSKIALVMRPEEIAAAPGLDEAATILLGDGATTALAELRERATKKPPAGFALHALSSASRGASGASGKGVLGRASRRQL